MVRKRVLSSGKQDGEHSRRRGSGVTSKSSNQRFRCPVRARAGVNSPMYSDCRRDQSFSNIEKLNEHLTRVHSSKYWCLRCKEKFGILNEQNLQVVKRGHKACCQERPWPADKEQWAIHTLMSKEQHDRWTVWTTMDVPRLMTKDGKTRERKPTWSWRKIYKSLFPDTVEFPSPFANDRADSCVVPDFSNQTGQMLYRDDMSARTVVIPSYPEEQVGNHVHYGGGGAGFEGTATEGDFMFELEPQPFLSSYSMDHATEQQHQDEEIQRQVPWEESATGPTSMVFSVA